MMLERRVTLSLLLLLAAVYLVLGWRYATRTPRWQVPDEPAHYNYIRQIADEGRIPVIESGDWDSAYQQQLLDSGFDPQYTNEIERIEYEDHQPPLYYLLASPLYALSDGDLTTLRLFSVFLGLGVALAAFFVVSGIFPGQPWLALTAAGFVAFIPQHMSMMSGVNNDALAELLVGVIFLAILRYLWHESPGLRDAALLGGVVGLALLTKSTIYFTAGVALAAILLKWRRGWSRDMALRHLAAFLIPALLLGGIWWGRNLSVYGGADFLGLQRHDEVASGQLQKDDYIRNDLNGDVGQYRKDFLYTTFHSFWGQFGWMAVPMTTRIYRLLLLLCAVILVGSFLYVWRAPLDNMQRDMFTLFALTVVFVLAAYLLYNRRFVQFQGRYLYPALIPLGVWFAIGLAGWVNLAAHRLPWLRWMIVPAAFSLAFLSWYALEKFIVPGLVHWE